MALHQLLKKTHTKTNNCCLSQFPHLQYGDAITLTWLLWRIPEAMPCPAGQNLLAPAALDPGGRGLWGYRNGGSAFAFLMTPQPPARQPRRTGPVIDVIPLSHRFEVSRRKVCSLRSSCPCSRAEESENIPRAPDTLRGS